MARYFEISGSTSTVKLDTQGRGTMQYKVKNVSAAAVDGRAVLTSLPATNPPAGVVQNGWVKIEPPSDRAFEKDKQETFVVKIEVPQKDRSRVGTYTFRLDAVTVAVPDRGDEGPAVAFTVEAAPIKSPNKLAWLIPLILFLLIVAGLGAWFVLRNTGPKVPDAASTPRKDAVVPDPGGAPQKGVVVPDLAGMPLKDALAALTAAKLTLASPVDTIKSKPEDADKVVTQTPAAGVKAKEGEAVQLKMGARMIVVPTGRIAIMNANSGLCLSPAGGGRDNNGQIVQFTCDQDPSRFWNFMVVDSDIVKIMNTNSGLCLTIAGGSAERNSVSVQYTCDSDPARRWRYTVVDGARVRLVNLHSGLCLTIAGGGTGRNTTAVQFPCDGDPSRDWQIRPSS